MTTTSGHSGRSRFTRTVYDVDRSSISPFEWRRWPQVPRRYVRRMGLIESFFHTMAVLHEGRTDIFYRMPLQCPANRLEALLDRLPIVWAVLCRRHPLLTARIANLTPDLEELSEQDATKRRRCGEASTDASISFEPHFVIDVPDTASSLIQKAANRVTRLSSGWEAALRGDSVKKPSDGSVPGATIDWLEHNLWNGRRRFLHQGHDFGLGSLIVLPSRTNPTAGRSSFDVVICLSHCIADGLSVTGLAAELLELLACGDLPDRMPELLHRQDSDKQIEGATLAEHVTINFEMQHAVATGLFKPRSKLTETADDTLKLSEIEPLLPPCIESSYPDQLQAVPNLSASSRRARLRWFWAIRRTIAATRAARMVEPVLTEFKAQRSEGTAEMPWWGSLTKWSLVALSKETTAALTKISKRKGVRLGSLTYAVSAYALNTLEREDVSSQSSASPVQRPTETVMGFPFSIRKYLDPVSPVFDSQAPVSPSTAQPSQLAVRLGFGGVSLPAPDVFSLPTTDMEVARRLSAAQAALLWNGGRHVQRQFDAMFTQPQLMCADGFLSALQRENKFRQHGVQDVFQVPVDDDDDREETDADGLGADERRPGQIKKNMQGPGSSLNFSMVGLLDHILPATLPLPPLGTGEASEQSTDDRIDTLTLESGVMFGVRTRSGEAFGTAFTFRGRLHLELGHDTVLWDTVKVERYLLLMEAIIEGLVRAA